MPDDNDDPYFTPDPVPSRRGIHPSDRVRQIAARSNISPEIADDYLKTTQIESGSNVNARPSSKGALGFGQVMPDVKGGSVRTVGGKQYNLKDPDQNIEAGLRYFAEGGPDPTSRRLYYFGGPKAKKHYEETEQIPNISDGNMTAAQYVKETGGEGPLQNPRDRYFTPQPAQTDPYFTPNAEVPQGRGAAMAKPVRGAQPIPLTSNDAAWHFGMTPEEAKKLTPKALRVLTDAVTEDQRKKADGETIAPPPLKYQNDMRRQAGLQPLKFNVATDASKPSPYYQPTSTPFSLNEKKTIEVRRPFTFNQPSDDQIKAGIQSQVASEAAQAQNAAPSRLQGGGVAPPSIDVQAETEKRFNDFKAERAKMLDYARLGPRVGARNNPNERASAAISDLLQKYAPGIASIDTPGGLKTDVLRGVASGLNVVPGPQAALLNQISQPREITPDEKILDPNAEANAGMARTLGQTSTAFLPFIGAGKLVSAAGVASPVLRDLLTFGLAEAGKQLSQTGKIDPESLAETMATGGVMGKIAGVDPSLKRRLVAYIVPQLAASVAKGEKPDQILQGATQNALFALAGGHDAKEQAPTQTVPDALQAKLRGGEIDSTLAAREAAVKPTVQPENVPTMRVTDRVEGVQPVSLPSAKYPETKYPENVGVVGPTKPVEAVEEGAKLNRWQHRDFGLVTESADQSGAPRGKVKVLAEDGTEHIIQRPKGTGAGNQIAVPVRAKVTDSRLQDAAAQAEENQPFKVIDRRSATQPLREGVNEAQVEANPNQQVDLSENRSIDKTQPVPTPGTLAPEVGSVAEPVRHVDLQPRRQRGDGKGQFKEETRAQRESRLAKVNPEQPNTVVPAMNPLPAKEPSIAQGFTRLYRGMSGPPDYFPKAWMESEYPLQFRGRWVTPDKEYARQFSKTDADISYVDIPTADLAKYSAEGLPGTEGLYQERGKEFLYPSVPQTPVEAAQPANLEPKADPYFTPEPSKVFGRTGIARRVEESRRTELDQEPLSKGEGISAQDSVVHGRELLAEGRSPEQVISDFKKNGSISADAMALVRAKHEELTRVANKAFDEGGQNLNDPKFKDAEKARQDFWENSVRPMQTEWHKTGMAQQGETDIDTGTFYGLYRAFKDQTGREMSPREEYAAKNLAAKVSAKESNVQEANRTLIDALNKATGMKDLDPEVQKALSKFVDESKRETRTQKRQQTRKTLDEEAALIKSNIAAEFARLKSQAGQSTTLSQQGLALLDPDGVITKELVRYAKNRVKAGITDTAQLIDDTHAFIKDFADVSRRQVAEALTGVTSRDKREPSDWMNVKGGIKEGLKAEDAAQRLKDLGSRVASGRISPEDPKALWGYATDKYIDKGVEYGEAVQKVATDLGATPEQARRVLTTKSNVKPLEDAAYQRMAARRQAKTAAEQWVKNADRSPALRVAQGASDAFFNLATFGHGTVGPVTHAAENIFHPTRWVDYFKNVGRTWKAAYSSSAHERYMQDLVNDPNYTTARRAGLANEPGKFYDEYQNNLAQKMFGSIGKIGNRGFDVLKRMRQDFFNQRWAKLDESQKTPEMAKAIADLVNHSTGAIRTKLPHAALARGVFFAAPLELSRWARILGDPVRAGDTFTNWKSATPSEKYFAKSVVKNHAGFLATYLGALALNQAVLTASDSKDKVNFTDPSRSDWLRFKVKGRTLDLSGGVIGTLGFLGRLGQASFGAPNPREGRFERIGKASADYARGKLSPIASVGMDVVTQSDFRGRPMPFSSDKEKEGRPRYSWPEYLISRTSPIPISEGARDFFDEMHKQGVPVDTTKAIFNAAVSHPMSLAKGVGIGAVSGSTGVRIGAEFTEKNASGKLVGSKGGDDPLAKELMRLGKQVNGTAKDKEESQAQFEKRRDYVNKEIEADLKSLIDSREYKRLSESEKKQQITMHLMNVTRQSNENYRLQNNLSKPPALRQVYIEPPRTVAP